MNSKRYLVAVFVRQLTPNELQIKGTVLLYWKLFKQIPSKQSKAGAYKFVVDSGAHILTRLSKERLDQRHSLTSSRPITEVKQPWLSIGLSISLLAPPKHKKLPTINATEVLKFVESLASHAFFISQKIKLPANLILSIGTCYAEKVAAQMSKSCRPYGQWAALMDNPGSGLVDRWMTIENQVYPKSKIWVPVAQELVVGWTQIRDCDSCCKFTWK